MRDKYIKPSMEIDCFEIEDIITLSAAGGNQGGEEPSSESSTGSGGTEAPTNQEPEDITGEAGFDSDIMGGNEFQEMLENLYQNFIKYI
ncbi:MAG: hypothetical protein GX107_08245 [Clostridiales bacterium]|nr:hypothetical protein [Clostridiales bacterium]